MNNQDLKLTPSRGIIIDIGIHAAGVALQELAHVYRNHHEYQ